VFICLFCAFFCRLRRLLVILPVAPPVNLPVVLLVVLPGDLPGDLPVIQPVVLLVVLPDDLLVVLPGDLPVVQPVILLVGLLACCLSIYLSGRLSSVLEHTNNIKELKKRKKKQSVLDLAARLSTRLFVLGVSPSVCSRFPVAYPSMLRIFRANRIGDFTVRFKWYSKL
jgi:hypothetical protein